MKPGDLVCALETPIWMRQHPVGWTWSSLDKNNAWVASVGSTSTSMLVLATIKTSEVVWSMVLFGSKSGWIRKEVARVV